jgi:hypothetical protein
MDMAQSQGGRANPPPTTGTPRRVSLNSRASRDQEAVGVEDQEPARRPSRDQEAVGVEDQEPARAGSGEFSVASVSDLVQRIIAPTTILAALAYYFGRQFTYARASYFGIDVSVLGLSAQDYVLRSADALFVPLGALVLVGLACVYGHMWIRRRIIDARFHRPISVLSHGLRAVGALVLALGIYGAFVDFPFPVYYLIPPLCPAVGVLLLAYGSYLYREASTDFHTRNGSTTLAISKVLLGAFILLSLFWTASDYATALGNGRARQVAERLSMQPATTILSAKRLLISGPGVREQRINDSSSAYHYRYDGLRLLLRSGGHYFLIPDSWSRSRGAVIMLPESGDVRLEFKPGLG